MFVSETGTLRTAERGPLSANGNAAAIYRNNVLTNVPGTDPDGR